METTISAISVIFNADFVNSVLRVTTPLLFATMAVLISNRAGVLNIGVEGLMLISALSGVIGSAYSGSAWFGLLFAILVSLIFSWIFAIFVLKLRTNATLAGIALNLFASGFTVFVLFVLTGDKGVSTSLASKTLPTVSFPGLENVKILSEQNVMTWLGIISVILISVYLNRTKGGTHIRAVGENWKAVEAAGVNVFRVKLRALLLCGVLAACGGAFMSMVYVSMFTKDMIAGRGFIAIAAEAVGQGIPFRSMIMAFVFGFADALSNNLQMMFDIHNSLVRMIPYMVTILAVAIGALNKRRRRHKIVA